MDQQSPAAGAQTHIPPRIPPRLHKVMTRSPSSSEPHVPAFPRQKVPPHDPTAVTPGSGRERSGIPAVSRASEAASFRSTPGSRPALTRGARQRGGDQQQQEEEEEKAGAAPCRPSHRAPLRPRGPRSGQSAGLMQPGRSLRCAAPGRGCSARCRQHGGHGADPEGSARLSGVLLPLVANPRLRV